MHILHIANSYGGTEVYKNLFMALDRLGVRQTVFVPLNPNNHNRIGNQLIDFEVQNSKIIYSTALKKRHKFFYSDKIKTIVHEIEKEVDLETVDYVHGHTLCVDGAAAYKIWKKLCIPFGCAVRNTDVNTYYKKFPWKKSFYTKILLKAKNIFFISPIYLKQFIANQVPDSIHSTIEDKAFLIPNGIDSFYLECRSAVQKTISAPIRLVFVSAFKKGKGLIETIQAVNRLRDDGIDIVLKAIGRGLPGRGYDAEYIQKVEEAANGNPWIELCDYMGKEDLIKELSKQDIFIMPSKPETFGLVYVEALSQNLPIIYTKGQGFDGFYPDGKVGYSTIFGDVDDIVEKIKLIIKNYDQLSNTISQIELDELFDWNHVAKKYVSKYEQR